MTILFDFRHYGSNRAPLILGFDAAWLEINKGFTKELAGWIRDTLADHSDVYFVTQIQVIDFINRYNIPEFIVEFLIQFNYLLSVMFCALLQYLYFQPFNL